MKKVWAAKGKITGLRFSSILSFFLLLMIGLGCSLPVQNGSNRDQEGQTLSTPVVLTITDTPTAGIEEPTPEPTPTPTATPEIEEEKVSRSEVLENSKLPAFDQFIQDLKTGESGRVAGIWVDNILALRVVYQPSDQPAFVSTDEDVATFFLLPWEKAGNYGLIAHNNLAGKYFFNLQVGDIISLVFGDGDYMDFEITQIKQFQALQPHNVHTNFLDTATGEQLTVNEVFFEVYMGDFHTTLQTCIAYGGNSEWGRLFTIAPPLY